MIARFRVLLPYDIFVPHGVQLQPLSIRRGSDVFEVAPPLQAQLYRGDEAMTSGVATRTVLERLAPQIPPFMADTVLVNGQSVIPYNLVQIEVRRDTFDRTPRDPGDPLAGDELVESFFSVANELLAALRSVTNAPAVKPIWPVASFWRIDFAADDGQPLPQDNTNVRRRMVAQTRWQASGLTREAWDHAAANIGASSPPSWQMLILDAEAILPEIGPAVVLAATALETLIAVVLDRLATSSNAISAPVWEWINDRGDYRKEPSFKEQYDVLLKAFTGKSLKDQPQLWELAEQLRAARNSFVHQGVAAIGKRQVAVTPQKAQELILGAKQIIMWVENLLGAPLRPRLTHPIVVEVFKPLEEPRTERGPG